MQVEFELQSSFTDNQGVKHRSINYVADFVYKEGDKVVVEDLKSKITAENPVYRIKRNCFYTYLGVMKIILIMNLEK